MFAAITDRLTRLQRRLMGYGRLSEQEIAGALRDIRTVLLDADVNYKVVGHFIRKLESTIRDKKIDSSLRPGEVVSAALYQEMVELLGGRVTRLDLSSTLPVIVLLGLQGTGKTTLAGKLAYRHKSRRPLLVACDPKRPAAAQQLESVAARAEAGFFPVLDDVVGTVRQALRHARDSGHRLVIIDTAGRLHIDEELMNELAAVISVAQPSSTLLVLDGMVGQDAVQQAESFHQRFKITGCCFTKLDGDARGGAVLSVRQVTGLPIIFIGTGEHLADLEEFHPDRIASRILGMGDAQSLTETVQAAVAPELQVKTAQRLAQGKFDLEDFLNQLRNIRKAGSLSKLLSMIPGGQQVEFDEREFVRVEAMIQSMTPEERHNPDIIDGSRRRRIAAGSGNTVADVNRLLKEFAQARELARALGTGRLGVPGKRGGFRLR